MSPYLEKGFVQPANLCYAHDFIPPQRALATVGVRQTSQVSPSHYAAPPSKHEMIPQSISSRAITTTQDQLELSTKNASRPKTYVISEMAVLREVCAESRVPAADPNRPPVRPAEMPEHLKVNCATDGTWPSGRDANGSCIQNHTTSKSPPSPSEEASSGEVRQLRKTLNEIRKKELQLENENQLLKARVIEMERRMNAEHFSGEQLRKCLRETKLTLERVRKDPKSADNWGFSRQSSCHAQDAGGSSSESPMLLERLAKAENSLWELHQQNDLLRVSMRSPSSESKNEQFQKITFANNFIAQLQAKLEDTSDRINGLHEKLSKEISINDKHVQTIIYQGFANAFPELFKMNKLLERI